MSWINIEKLFKNKGFFFFSQNAEIKKPLNPIILRESYGAFLGKKIE